MPASSGGHKDRRIKATPVPILNTRMSNTGGAVNLPGLKKSIRKTVTAGHRKRVNSLTEISASPVLSIKRKRATSETQEGEPVPKKMAAENDILAALAQLQASMGELKQKVDSIPNRDDFERMDGNVKSIRREVANNTERLDNMTRQQEEERKGFVRNVERVIDERMAYHKTIRSGVLTPTAGEAEKERLFLLARRTMLLWPVDLAAEAGNAVRSFIESTLGVPKQVVKSLNIEQVDKLQQGRRSRISNEVRVVFATSRERDLVQSYASNLAKMDGRAGLRMEVPEHMRGLFKIFEAHGASLRQKYPGLKRAIKYDDATQSLCMDVRMPERERWHRINESEMREIARRNNTRMTSNETDGPQDVEDRNKILSLDTQPGLPVVEEEDNEQEDQ